MHLTRLSATTAQPNQMGRPRYRAMIQMSKKSGCSLCAIHHTADLLTRSFTPLTRLHQSLVCDAHSIACSSLLALLERSAVLIPLLASSLTRFQAHEKEVFVYEMNASISYNLNPLCCLVFLTTSLSGLTRLR